MDFALNDDQLELKQAGARVARRALPARPRLGARRTTAGRSSRSSAGSTSRRRASASSRRRSCSRSWATPLPGLLPRPRRGAGVRRGRRNRRPHPPPPAASRTKLPVSAPPQRPRRSASRSASSSSGSSTRRRASSSASRSASTRPSPTSSRTRTPTSSSRARSSTGPRGASPRTTSRRPLAAAAAKAFATEAAVAACERSIQVHGGTGFTWEHPLHRFYKRALWLEGFGSPARRAASRSRGRRARRSVPSDRGGSDGRPDDGLPADADAPPRAARRRSSATARSSRACPTRASTARTYRETMRRARQLAVALQKLGLERGDRVATLCWNHYQHHEAYFGIPCGGFVLHTLNLRLHPNDLAYIATHADDRAVIVDRALLPLLEQFRERTNDRARLRRRGLVRGAARDRRSRRVARTRSSTRTRPPRCVTRAARPAGRRASSTRTARPSCTRSASARTTRSGSASASTTRSCRSCRCSTRTRGATRTSRRCRARSSSTPARTSTRTACSRTWSQEKVTWAAGVPTIWMGILARLDAEPGRWDLSAMKAMLVGGSAVPRAMIAAFEERHGLKIVPGLGHDRDVAGRLDRRAAATTSRTATRRRAGTTRRWPASRCRSSRSARASATRTCRGTARRWASSRCAGPWVASPATTTRRSSADRWTADGWFRPATSSRSIRAASSRSRTARRT